VHSPVISYRPLLLAIGALAAMALAAINPWIGAALLAAILVTLIVQLLGAVTPTRRRVAVDFEPLSPSDYAEMRRHYRRD